jgi:FMN-dependent oxidoreductase (nitrilotriacetate monooxygenase family)
MTADRPRRMSLFNFAYHTGAHVAGWRHPHASSQGLHSLAYYQEVARLSERGKFDAIFFADALGFRQARGRDAFSHIDGTALDPMTVLAALAATTTHLGLVATGSTLNPPYTLARQFASLDHLSGGRAGWNIVTSTSDHEARNLGLARMFPHDERYARATEFVEIVKALWDGVEDGALVMDKARGLYIDPGKIHAAGYRGKFFQVAGPLNMARPPQGHPVLIQAGASDAGRDFSARFAECVFISVRTAETAQAFYTQMKAAAAAIGRDPDSVRLLQSIKVFVGSTEAEAARMVEELNDLIHADTALSVLETVLGGFDLSAHDPDGPLPPLPVSERSRSAQDEVVDWARRDNLTIRQLARKFAAQRTGGLMVGTPEQLADILEHWFTTRAADGFAVGAAYFPGQFAAFVDQVVPVLQKRGIFRRDYEGATLRDHLGLPRPPNSFAEHPERHVEPEVW